MSLLMYLEGIMSLMLSTKSAFEREPVSHVTLRRTEPNSGLNNSVIESIEQKSHTGQSALLYSMAWDHTPEPGQPGKTMCRIGENPSEY